MSVQSVSAAKTATETSDVVIIWDSLEDPLVDGPLVNSTLRARWFRKLIQLSRVVDCETAFSPERLHLNEALVRSFLGDPHAGTRRSVEWFLWLLMHPSYSTRRAALKGIQKKIPHLAEMGLEPLTLRVLAALNALVEKTVAKDACVAESMIRESIRKHGFLSGHAEVMSSSRFAREYLDSWAQVLGREACALNASGRKGFVSVPLLQAPWQLLPPESAVAYHRRAVSSALQRVTQSDAGSLDNGNSYVVSRGFGDAPQFAQFLIESGLLERDALPEWRLFEVGLASANLDGLRSARSYKVAPCTLEDPSVVGKRSCFGAKRPKDGVSVRSAEQACRQARATAAFRTYADRSRALNGQLTRIVACDLQRPHLGQIPAFL